MYENEDDAFVHVHVRDNMAGGPFAEILERYSFLDSLIFSFRLWLIHIMSTHD